MHQTKRWSESVCSKTLLNSNTIKLDLIINNKNINQHHINNTHNTKIFYMENHGGNLLARDIALFKYCHWWQLESVIQSTVHDSFISEYWLRSGEVWWEVQVIRQSVKIWLVDNLYCVFYVVDPKDVLWMRNMPYFRFMASNVECWVSWKIRWTCF